MIRVGGETALLSGELDAVAQLRGALGSMYALEGEGDSRTLAIVPGFAGLAEDGGEYPGADFSKKKFHRFVRQEAGVAIVANPYYPIRAVLQQHPSDPTTYRLYTAWVANTAMSITDQMADIELNAFDITAQAGLLQSLSFSDVMAFIMGKEKPDKIEGWRSVNGSLVSSDESATDVLDIAKQMTESIAAFTMTRGQLRKRDRERHGTPSHHVLSWLGQLFHGTAWHHPQ